MRRILDFCAAFRLAFEAARNTAPAPFDAQVDAHVAAAKTYVETSTPEPTRVIAPAPASWPDEHQWVNVEVECETCGDFLLPVTTAWLLWHAHESLECPVCHLPTGQNISYEASA